MMKIGGNGWVAWNSIFFMDRVKIRFQYVQILLNLVAFDGHEVDYSTEGPCLLRILGLGKNRVT